MSYTWSELSPKHELIGLSLSISISAGYVISREIASGIGRGISFVQEVAKGELRQHMVITGKDETGVLGQSLNEMAANLKVMGQQGQGCGR